MLFGRGKPSSGFKAVRQGSHALDKRQSTHALNNRKPVHVLNARDRTTTKKTAR